MLWLILLVCGELRAQQVTGELRQWHDVVLTFDGPRTSESATPNPFLHYRLDVTFAKGQRKYVAPGYYAADGNAAETGAKAGNKWRVHFVPDEVGEWRYKVSFRSGPDVAVHGGGAPLAPDGVSGALRIAASDKTGRDHHHPFSNRRLSTNPRSPSSVRGISL